MLGLVWVLQVCCLGRSLGMGWVAQQLTLTALLEDLGSNPTTWQLTTVHNYIPVDLTPSSGYGGHQALMWYRHTCRQNALKCNIKTNLVSSPQFLNLGLKENYRRGGRGIVGSEAQEGAVRVPLLDIQEAPHP